MITKVLDAGHKLVVGGLCLATAYLAAELGNGYYHVRKHRLEFEANNDVEAMVKERKENQLKVKADRENEKEDGLYSYQRELLEKVGKPVNLVKVEEEPVYDMAMEQERRDRLKQVRDGQQAK